MAGLHSGHGIPFLIDPERNSAIVHSATFPECMLSAVIHLGLGFSVRWEQGNRAKCRICLIFLLLISPSKPLCLRS